MTNAFDAVLRSELVMRFGWMLLHSVWQCVVVAVGLAGFDLAVRKSAGARYLAACAALLVMIVAPVVTFLGTGSAGERNVVATRPSDVPPVVKSVSGPTPVGVVDAPKLMTRDLAVPHDTQLTGTSDGLAIAEHTGTDLLQAGLPWVVLVWLVGVVSLALWNLGGWLSLRRLRSVSTCDAGATAGQAVSRLAGRLGIRRRVSVLRSTLAKTPMVIGAIRPVVLLPASVLTELSLAELESILAHELAHVRRHDYLINLVQTALETLLFYHPAAWWVSKRIRIERENCCDDLALSVTQDRAAYVTALAAAASVRVPALAAASSGGKLVWRLRRILGLPDADANGSRWASGAAVLATGMVVLLAVALPRSVNAASDDADVVTVHGRVVDPAGKPVAGARVMSVYYSFQSPVSETKSAADGRFKLSFQKSKFVETLWSWEDTVVAATFPGFGPGWARQDRVDGSGDLVLTLAPDDIPIEGRILNLEGQPVPDAKVYVTTIRPKAVDLKKLNIDRSDPDNELGIVTPNLNAHALGDSMVTQTNAEGRFRFTGLGRERTIEMIAQAPDIANSYIEAVTRRTETQRKDFQSYLKVTETTYGASFDFTATPGRTVSGIVRDAATREPLSGVVIKTGYVMMEGITDAQGHYRIEGFKKDPYTQITAVPNEGQPYVMCDAEVPLMTGFGPITIDVDLHRGVVFTGKVTDNAGKPLPMMDVQYFPYLSNNFAQAAPEFRKNSIPGRYGPVRTKADGSYRIVGLPGQALLTVRGFKTALRKGVGVDAVKCPQGKVGYQTFTYAPPSKDSHNAIRDLDVPEGQAQATVDFTCDRGLAVHLHLADSEGKPVTGVFVVGHIPGRGERIISPDVDVVALAPDEKRTVYLFQKSRRIGKILDITPNDVPGGNLDVKLEPCSTLTGRLIGKDGQPHPAASVMTSMVNLTPTATDENGRFTLTVIPGPPVSVRGIKGVMDFLTDVRDLSVAPGTTKDLGDVHVK